MEGTSTEAAPAAEQGGAQPDGRAAKLEAAAKKRREQRAAAKAKRVLADKKNRQLARDAGTASPEDQQATQAEPEPAVETTDDGWPPDEAIAGAMPGARQLIKGFTEPLKLTRFGEMAFTERTEDVVQEDGSKKSVTYDPVGMLATPVAAMLAASGRRATPGVTLLFNAGMVLGPPAVTLSVIMLFEYLEERKKRDHGLTTKKNGADAPAQLPATSEKKAPVSA